MASFTIMRYFWERVTTSRSGTRLQTQITGTRKISLALSSETEYKVNTFDGFNLKVLVKYII
jgi:hypothetical protein